uniref:Major facilitator superfamily (MFS) profile domain-containing protein n=1 Tax=Spongospora subterranea TaxID=70186 RepID=A0A0H5RBA6_9EUKA|eukprot:CRZ10902.1 hypothetical protein [Spongospora subterranea]
MENVSEPGDRNETETGITESKVVLVFIIYLTVLVAINIDSGAIPSSLECIKRSVHLSYFGEGLLGALVFIGVAFSSIFAGSVFGSQNPKWVLTISVLFNGIASLSFAMATTTFALLASRTMVGVTQAFPIIYGPIYVDKFAPPNRSTLWMSLVYVCSPFGIMLGYAAGVYASKDVTSSNYNDTLWRYPLFAQGLLLCLLTPLLAVTPIRYLVGDNRFTVNGSTPDLESSCRNPPPEGHTLLLSNWASFRSLLTNGVFLWTTCNLTVLFFVVTGIQYWISLYLKEVCHTDVIQTGVAFIAISATAPTAGVLFGGWLIDYIGGYIGPQQTIKAMKTNAILGAIAIASALVLMSAGTLTTVMVLVFVLLFAGGATVPSCTGILVTCVPSHLQAHASSVSQLAFNVFGFALSTVVSGLIMQLTSSRLWGFRSVLLWSLWGIIAVALGYKSALRNLVSSREDDSQIRIPCDSAMMTPDAPSREEISCGSHSYPPFPAQPNLMMDLTYVLGPQ